MLERDFWRRILKFGIINLIKSPDTIIAIIVFLGIGVLTNWTICKGIGYNFIDDILPISAAFFAIILAGLAIIASFTDKDFIHAWVESGLFEDLVTLFQWNLYIPLVVTVFALFIKFVYYNSLLLILLISLFIYMVISFKEQILLKLKDKNKIYF
jgi:hypothetical protein